MSDIVIKAEGLSKKFVLGHERQQRYTALRDVIANNVKGALRRTRDLFKDNVQVEGDTEEVFWALRDLDFEICQGDRIGVIGRNGAGKSTLLKVLSRITEPTAGRVTIRGRVASLLEVGTGFHPELTGRENIFLNGAILGMSRQEIRRKFDEIVAFAEVEKFLDTPVKRYSSGMYVRLAFAVAAHLEPEILIVDEVLAVGDAQFQKKCLGKMEDVSKNEGRTILFVSHNMGVINTLCEKSIFLEKGRQSFIGPVSEGIERYMASSNNVDLIRYVAAQEKQNKDCYFSLIETCDSSGKPTESFLFSESIHLRFRVRVRVLNPSTRISITLQNYFGDYLSTLVENVSDHISLEGEEKELVIKLPHSLIAPNNYAFRFCLFVPQGEVYDLVEMICPVKIVDSGTKLAQFEGFNYGNFMMDYEVL